jgi:hypothetical protein
MGARIDLAADLGDEDDEGLGWSTLSGASDPARIRPGVMVVAGNRQVQAVVRVVAVDDDGQVHFAVLIFCMPCAPAGRPFANLPLRSVTTARPVRTDVQVLRNWPGCPGWPS